MLLLCCKGPRPLLPCHRALLVLENVCFACPDNEARLLAVTVQTGLPPLVATTGAPAASVPAAADSSEWRTSASAATPVMFLVAVVVSSPAAGPARAAAVLC